jgi:hypothetical protein
MHSESPLGIISETKKKRRDFHAQLIKIMLVSYVRQFDNTLFHKEQGRYS